jgi:nucleotide-binding universal stress UspA family protein
MFKHILVGLDGSDCSHRALDLAVKLVREQEARCTVCTVVDIVRAASSMTFAPGDIVNEWIATLNQDAREFETQAVQKYSDPRVNIESVVVEGYPSQAIIDVAKKKGADLIVMGSHGRSGLKRLWLGSVAESVVREAPVPVLIVR